MYSLLKETAPSEFLSGVYLDSAFTSRQASFFFFVFFFFVAALPRWKCLNLVLGFQAVLIMLMKLYNRVPFEAENHPHAFGEGLCLRCTPVDCLDNEQLCICLRWRKTFEEVME